jgi:oligoribonuclease
MKRFAFLDFETTGLDETVCAPIEVAVVVTDEQLVELGSCESLIIPVPGCVWDTVPDVRALHERSGLAGEASRYGVGVVTVEGWLSERLAEFREPDTTLHLAGNSVHFDRRFLKRYFPAVETLLHHRHLDVSSVRMLAEAAGHPPLNGEKPHRAMADVRESLEDARRFLGAFRCP